MVANPFGGNLGPRVGNGGCLQTNRITRGDVDRPYLSRIAALARRIHRSEMGDDRPNFRERPLPFWTLTFHRLWPKRKDKRRQASYTTAVTEKIRQTSVFLRLRQRNRVVSNRNKVSSYFIYRKLSRQPGRFGDE